MAHEAGSPHVVVVGHGYSSYHTEEGILAPYGVMRLETTSAANADFYEVLGRATAIMVREAPIRAEHIAAAPALKVIVRYGIGVDNVDLEAARSRHIYVANVPEYGIEDVSDHALALLLAVSRHLVTRDQAVRRGAWNIGQAEPIRRTGTLSVGLVGYGKIARAFHRKVRALGVQEVLAFDPYLKAAPEGVRLVDFGTLCERADILSLHAPLTPETRHIIDAEALARMKQGAILINTSRGALIDEGALVQALESGRLAGAGLDVFEQEPPKPDHPLFGLKNVVLTDHNAWYSESSVQELQEGAAREVARVLSGEPPRAWVNRWEEAQ